MLGDGAFAEYLMLPAANLHPLSEWMSDDAATFVQPLAVALDILEQRSISVPGKLVARRMPSSAPAQARAPLRRPLEGSVRTCAVYSITLTCHLLCRLSVAPQKSTR